MADEILTEKEKKWLKARSDEIKLFYGVIIAMGIALICSLVGVWVLFGYYLSSPTFNTQTADLNKILSVKKLFGLLFTGLILVEIFGIFWSMIWIRNQRKYKAIIGKLSAKDN